MKKMTRRILAAVLALALCFSTFPTAMAAEGEATVAEAAETVDILSEAPAEDVAEPEAPVEDATESEASVEDAAEPEAPVEDAAESEAPAEDTVEAEAPATEVGEEELTETEEATETTVPTVESLTITVGGQTYGTVEGGNIVINAPSSALLSDCTVTLTASQAVTFVQNAMPNAGDLYVSAASENSATLNFNVSYGEINLNNTAYSLTLTSNDGVTWSGSFSNAVMTLDGLAIALENQSLQLAAGAMNSNSQAHTLLINQDSANVYMILCAPDAILYTVTYVVGETSYAWQLPAGVTVPQPDFAQVWFTDESHTDVLASTAQVVNNLTVYGQEGAVEPTDFLGQLQAHQTAVIEDLDDWETFVAHSTEAVSGQLIVLDADIDCQGRTYDPLVFAGNFDGQNNTISNAKFNAVDSAYNSSSENDIKCSGMFAAIGPGQIIANLKLHDLEAKTSSTYAGILAGLVDGAYNNRALIQNIQVTGGSATGRTAAGVTGFLRNADVKFCSSRDTRITGAANGGGIVGINNNKVQYCYSTTSPTALSSLLGGSKGGVVSKKVRGGYSEYCWATMTVIGSSDSGGTDIGAFEVSADTTEDDFITAGFNAAGAIYWELAEGTDTDFDFDAITYAF